jgi:hypothetical protein
MLTREQLLKKIEEGGGSWEPEGSFKFYLDKRDGTTIYAEWTSELGYKYDAFWIRGHKENNPGEFYFNTTCGLSEGDSLIEFVKKLSYYTDYDLGLDGVTAVEKEVYNKEEESRLAGKVEAYENLLINREINISL